jgi:hypothetical protein
MRQGQQNRRGRGRSNNNNNSNNNGHQNRKGQNPLTRSFESTGPDVKLRGTPAHIAEKYIMLARDAQSSGDPVLAENYLQHAEHYNRIIMAFREQQIAQGGGDVQNGMGRPRTPGFGEPVSMNDDFGDDEGGDMPSDVQGQPYMQPRSEGQPRHEGQRYDDRERAPRDDRERGPRQEGGGRQFHNRDRQDRGERSYSDRPDRGDRDRGERFQRNDRPDRGERPERVDRPDRPDRAPQPDIGVDAAPPPRRERPAVPHHEQPEFLRRPVRRPRREAAAATEDGDAPAPTPAVEGSGD